MWELDELPPIRWESYTYQIPGEPDLVWNITLAQALVAQGQTVALVEVPRVEMQSIADRYEWDPAKIDQVDPAVPGIGAPIIFDDRVAYLMIDGLHRNARALRDGLPFHVRLLTDKASRACLLQGDDNPRMPWNHRVEPAQGGSA